MSNLSKASIGVALVLVLALGAAWKVFAPPRQPATAPDTRSLGDSVEQPSKAVEPEVIVANQPSDPPSTVANEEPASTAAVPLDLTDFYGMKASVFDKITTYPWPAVPRGSQTFANVPLEIGGAIMLWGERNSKNGLVFPEQITGIPLQRKFETLYVCHGAFFEGEAGTPVWEAGFHYDDGTSASDAIVCGGDVRDWFANRAEATLGPSGPRATLAWDGDGKYGERTQAIRFCLTAIANPHPEKEVTTIDLVSSKSQTAACILAITTGKSGLMKRTEEARPGGARDE
jgi:hypothetical protein